MKPGSVITYTHEASVLVPKPTEEVVDIKASVFKHCN